MNTKQQIKISIPELCHEDWNKMTPNEKGSFCSKCCKTVVDFTQKSPEEIKSILIQNSGKKVCGRFMSDQLDEPAPLNIPIHILPKQVAPLRSFAIALFVVFGTTLFSCGTYNNAAVGEIQIDSIAITEETKPDPEPVRMGAINVAPAKSQTTEKDTVLKIKPVRKMSGEVEARPVSGCTPVKDTVSQEIRQREPIQKMGKIKVHKD